jgi:hypothetical protein
MCHCPIGGWVEDVGSFILVSLPTLLMMCGLFCFWGRQTCAAACLDMSCCRYVGRVAVAPSGGSSDSET